MNLLSGVVRPYAWGSRVAIAELQGRPTPSAHPEAELWFGAHPASPAHVRGGGDGAEGADGAGSDLLAVIGADPGAALGPATAETFDGRLPFLLKVLAADEALSLQAHPSQEQAREGYARENARRLALDHPQRNYRDASHKPELVVALTDFEALAGFREPAGTLELLRALQVPELDPYLGMLAGQPDAEGLRAVFTMWLTLPESVITGLIPPVLAAAVRILESGGTAPGSRFAPELRAVLGLGEAYPADPGVLAALLLNYLSLRPGEGIYLGAGNLHAYLRGVAVEVMANSDNVLRGGLTPKHIDVPELLRILDFTPVSRDDLAPSVGTLGAEQIYLTPAPEFRLSRVVLDGTGLRHAASISFDMPGPQILLVTEGRIEVMAAGSGPGESPRRLVAAAGEAVWLADADPDVIVRAASSHAVFFRALVPLG